MLASSSNVCEHPHLSERLCDACMEHVKSCIPPPQHSGIEQHSSSSDVDQNARNFDCNLCMDVCHDPVVTMCGHLFCWPCLYYHFSLHSASKECPVCKSEVQDKIVPLYGCGVVGHSTDVVAERFRGVQIPLRPSANRSIPPIACADVSQLQREPNQAIHLNGMMHAHRSFCECIFRMGMTWLPLRYTDSAVSLLVNRRRFSNEKEFVVHWAFICVGLVASVAFLAS